MTTFLYKNTSNFPGEVKRIITHKLMFSRERKDEKYVLLYLAKTHRIFQEKEILKEEI